MMDKIEPTEKPGVEEFLQVYHGRNTWSVDTGGEQP